MLCLPYDILIHTIFSERSAIWDSDLSSITPAHFVRCSRTGIMVQGQLEALGTSEHLKHKFGGGYDLVLRLSPLGGAALPDDPKRVNAITEYVLNMFPDADFISDNGGLLTYRVPRESIHVGTAFAGHV